MTFKEFINYLKSNTNEIILNVEPIPGNLNSLTILYIQLLLIFGKHVTIKFTDTKKIVTLLYLIEKLNSFILFRKNNLTIVVNKYYEVLYDLLRLRRDFHKYNSIRIKIKKRL